MTPEVLILVLLRPGVAKRYKNSNSHICAFPLPVCFSATVVFWLIKVLLVGLFKGTEHLFVAVNPCDKLDPCVNGKCVPSDDFLRSLCECPADYTGDECDIKSKCYIDLSQNVLEILQIPQLSRHCKVTSGSNSYIIYETRTPDVTLSKLNALKR